MDYLPNLEKEGACHCPRCRAAGEENGHTLLSVKEKGVRTSLADAVISLREKFPHLWLSGNAAAPEIWDNQFTGATARALSGLFDELVVEWTPNHESALKKIEDSIRHVRTLAPAARISHAYVPDEAAMHHPAIKVLATKIGCGRWCLS